MDNSVMNRYDWLNLMLTTGLLVTALAVWRITAWHNENMQNMIKICDRVGLEYVATTNFFGLRNNIIVK